MTKTRERTNYKATGAVLVMSVTSFGLLQGIVLPLLPTIQHELHTSEATATWVLTSFLLSASVFTPILGRVGDMVGKKKILVVTLGLLAFGCVLAGLANTVELLIVARIIQGVGGAIVPLSFGIVRDEYPADRVASGVGLLAAVAAAGAGAGVILAGPIIDLLDFHWLFWLLLLVTAFCSVCALIVIPESTVRTPGRVSAAGVTLLSLWLITLLLAISKSLTWGWGSPKVIGLIGVAVVSFVIWVFAESRSQQPLVDMTMMRNQAVWTNNLVAFLLGIGMFSVFTFIPEFVQTTSTTGYGFGASLVQSGLFLLPFTVTMFVVGVLAGRIINAIGSKSSVVIGLVIAFGAFSMLTFAHRDKWEIYLVTALLGVSMGLAYSAMSNLIVHAVPPAQTGVANGMNANIRTIGGAIGSVIVSSILASKLLASNVPAASRFTEAFGFLAGATLLAVVAGLLIPRSLSDRAAADHKTHLLNSEVALLAGGPIADA
jgi:EmrB/QacA subfamily drug resistance transporter